jgi:hypothetical protein
MNLQNIGIGGCGQSDPEHSSENWAYTRSLRV